jgi:formylglycine-generating enzyme required for sulfatase activity
LIDDPNASCFWMDATEVMVSDYRRWLRDLAGSPPDWGSSEMCERLKPMDAKPFDPDQPGDCRINDPPPLGGSLFGETLPIRCVDWCEADAYCRWADKRLCKVGTPTSEDEWQIACSAGYTQTHPFDPTAQGEPCNYEQNCASGCGPLPADQDTSCRPARGYPLNLGGNVDEWIDQCFPGDFCGTRGGSYVSPQDDIKCSYMLGGSSAANRDPRIGFRCCADLTSGEKTVLPD